MPENIISPGVFTNEIDQTRDLAPRIQAIGPAVVGPTQKGPALVPTQISSISEYEQYFGTGQLEESYVPEIVRRYLANGDVITVTRLLYEDGYTLTDGLLAIVATSGSGPTSTVEDYVTHVFHPTQAVTADGATSLFEHSSLLDGGTGSFALYISGGYTSHQGSDSAIGFDGSFKVGSGVAISASIDPSTTTNLKLESIFGSNPKGINHPIYQQYKNTAITDVFNDVGHVNLKLVTMSIALSQDFQSAATPFVTSQKDSGASAYNLFKFHTLSHGTSVNHEVKIGIRDIRLGTETSDPENYGTFTVVVRKVKSSFFKNTPYDSDDTDQTPEIVETYTRCNLNPDSPDYVARKIGTQFTFLDSNNEIKVSGKYRSNSRYIRVEVVNGIETKDSTYGTLVPFGFRALTSPIPHASASVNLAPTQNITTQDSSTGYNSQIFHGFDFTKINNLNYLSPIPTTSSTTGSNADFYLGDIAQSANANFPTVTSPYSQSLEGALTGSTFGTNIALKTRKFIVPFQGGFDGAKPNLKKYSGEYITAANTFGFDCSSTTSTGTKSYNKAFDTLSDTDFYDINMLFTPGLIDYLHPAVTAKARNLAIERQDTFYVMDIHEISSTVATVVNYMNDKSIDNNYTAVYWPWVQIPKLNGGLTFVPPSITVAGAIAFNDAISAPWYAPAGLNRGGLSGVSGTSTILSQQKRDDLYSVRVNPIANFPNDGVCIWGQKTLQATPSALDRVNVRRLLISVKKFIASATRFLVFDQNNSVTRDRFLAIVNPFLQQVKAQQGLNAFQVVMDLENKPVGYEDENLMYGQLFLQPTRTAEFIVLDFNIQPTGASFPE